MVQVAIFDLDGTILNTLKDLSNAANFALVELGLPLHTEEEYREMISYDGKRLVESMLPSNYQSMHKLATTFFEYYYHANATRETKPYEGIVDLLKQLKENQIKLVVLSNKPHSCIKKIIKHFFANIFDLVIGMREEEEFKVKSIQEVMDTFQVKKEDILYITDSNIDIEIGNQIPVSVAAVSWGYDSRELLMKANPAYMVSSPSELAEIILKEYVK